MRTNWTRLGLSFFLLFSSAVLHAATVYYVDFTAGSDGNLGTSTGSPFKHCPGDANASGTAGATALAPGDSVVFKGGVTYYGRIDANWSGSVGSVITYKSGDLASWGTGRAVVNGTGITLDYNVSTIRRGIFSLQGASNITVQGFEITAFPVYLNAVGYGGGISWIGSSGGNILVDNVYIHDGSENGIAIDGPNAGSSASGFTFQNSIIDNCGWHGILIQNGISNVLVDNNTIHNNGWAKEGNGLFFGGNTGSLTIENVVISRNTIYDNPVKGHMNLSGNHYLIERNYCYSTVPQSFGIQIATECFGSQATSSDFTIRNNVIEVNGIYEGCIRIQHTTTEPTAVIDGVKIYNNALIQQGQYYCVWAKQGTSTMAQSVKNIVIKNNLMVTQSGQKQPVSLEDSTVTSGFVSSNNHYFYGSQGTPFVWQGTAKTFAQWQAMGFDTFAHTQNVDPKVNSTYAPLGGSPLIKAGLDLSSEGFSNDFSGTPRPAGSWDIGAYQYAGPIVDVNKPSGLRMKTN